MKLAAHYQYRTRDGDVVDDLKLSADHASWFSPSTGLAYSSEGRTMLGKDNERPEDLVECLPFNFGQLTEIQQLQMQLAYFRDQQPIEIFEYDHSWQDVVFPSFSSDRAYRIKPPPEPERTVVISPQNLKVSYWHTNGQIDPDTIKWEIL